MPTIIEKLRKAETIIPKIEEFVIFLNTWDFCDLYFKGDLKIERKGSVMAGYLDTSKRGEKPKILWKIFPHYDIPFGNIHFTRETLARGEYIDRPGQSFTQHEYSMDSHMRGFHREISKTRLKGEELEDWLIGKIPDPLELVLLSPELYESINEYKSSWTDTFLNACVNLQRGEIFPFSRVVQCTTLPKRGMFWYEIHNMDVKEDRLALHTFSYRSRGNFTRYEVFLKRENYKEFKDKYAECKRTIVTVTGYVAS